MPYRNPQQPRLAAQTSVINQYAGFTGTLRHPVSASAGIPAAGFGSAVSYVEMTITAMLGGQMGSVVTPNIQRQTPAGQIADGGLRILTQQYLTDKDEFIWRGVRYSVDANSQPSPLNGWWLSNLRRRDS